MAYKLGIVFKSVFAVFTKFLYSLFKFNYYFNGIKYTQITL